MESSNIVPCNPDMAAPLRTVGSEAVTPAASFWNANQEYEHIAGRSSGRAKARSEKEQGGGGRETAPGLHLPGCSARRSAPPHPAPPNRHSRRCPPRGAQRRAEATSATAGNRGTFPRSGAGTSARCLSHTWWSRQGSSNLSSSQPYITTSYLWSCGQFKDGAQKRRASPLAVPLCCSPYTGCTSSCGGWLCQNSMILDPTNTSTSCLLRGLG
ncbi:uncharacterized protein LOC121101662 [Ursus maritimus]|uniref:Uncharacterized protein LOC121101662 n=1 Tax=Ursus maritimus TaxID=29073 RepID=A0A8M1FDR3_URSMA|nr:uncharacterized protein LOC121101662 [Ursus maritimus]